jgi:3'-phosphoadenosine 5'-phosphosulfate (PAPS) 3'-phosphatase
MKLSPLLGKLTEIALAAGTGVLRAYRETVTVEFKGPNDPVTSADKRCQLTHLRGAVAANFLNWPIVAEESDPEHFR